MMNINKTIQLFNTLLLQTDKNSEKQVYNYFIEILSSLNSRNLNQEQSKLIEEKLTSLSLSKVRTNRKKIYKRKLTEFKNFLKNELSLTTKKHYTELGMIYGMIFGPSIGLSIGTAINPVIGTSLGLSIGTAIGMVIGMMYGANKDAEAKKQGRVI